MKTSLKETKNKNSNNPQTVTNPRRKRSEVQQLGGPQLDSFQVQSHHAVDHPVEKWAAAGGYE
jgi:hypothetical protein